LSNEEPFPFSFLLNEEEITDNIQAVVNEQKLSSESVLSIVYQPQAIFRVRPVTRCSSTIPGHEEAILHCDFSADGKHLATGSGDSTVRLWDLSTETPLHTMKGHSSWVLAVAWSPLCQIIASGGMDNMVRLWDAATGKSKGRFFYLSHNFYLVNSVIF
jgi:ribosome assembly protein 4